MCSFGKKAAKKQAAATITAANMQADADRVASQGAQQALENSIAQEQAVLAAQDLLNVPQEQAEVYIGEDVPDAELDVNTGRRKTTRSSFQMARASSGISI